MNHQKLILAIDQGTTSSRAVVFARGGKARASAQNEFTQHYANDGWVEHDPEDLWQTTLQACREVLQQVAPAQVTAIGISNQRETTVIWERASGKPIYNAIVWHDRRTADECARLEADGQAEEVQAKTGLRLDAYFSASKIAWILRAVPGALEKAAAGELAFGTVDSFLIWRLTGGERHVTDASNASRTLLFDIHRQRWDEKLAAMFAVPMVMLPEVLDCAADFGVTAKGVLPQRIPICGVAGDQQAALVGQACFASGMLKSTYGTGGFLMMNTAERAAESSHQLLTTVGYRLNGKVTYALEGSIFHAGTTIQWLRDELGVISSVAEIDELLTTTDGNDGVYLLPAFTGLGAPHWQPHARGAIVGLTRGTGRAQLVRAALEAVGYQTRDLLTAMRADSGATITVLRVDGGMTANSWLLQFLADVLQVTVEVPPAAEASAWGAAILAGLQCGWYESPAEVGADWRAKTRFQPQLSAAEVAKLVTGWEMALARVV